MFLGHTNLEVSPTGKLPPEDLFKHLEHYNVFSEQRLICRLCCDSSMSAPVFPYQEEGFSNHGGRCAGKYVMCFLGGGSSGSLSLSSHHGLGGGGGPRSIL